MYFVYLSLERHSLDLIPLKKAAGSKLVRSACIYGYAAKRKFCRYRVGTKHQNKINSMISKVCRFCTEEIETFHHYLTDCPALRQIWTDIFRDKPFPNDNTWSIYKLKLFILEPSIYNTLTSKHGLTEIEREPCEIELPTDSDSSL